ncbi:MAG: hypothetical protein G8D84_19220 [gamma proteobacterium symbiont of Clathrolucina costata]
MFGLFKKKKPSEKARTPLVTDDDIPRYPPFAKGLPAAHTSRIIQTQDELIRRIKGSLRFNPEEFDRLVLPVIERYAAYFHLLPASEAHHHRGAGGLFRHGLEAGFWAGQRAESHQFCLGETPQNRRENEPRWQFASFLGGLLHDVGKPLSDVAVTDQSGKKEWNPYDSSLAEWSQRESIDRYFLRWRDKRNKRHEKFSMMNLDQIITPAAKSYLNKPGPHIMESLLEAIVGTSATEALTQIVMWADQESVRRDISNQRLDVDEYAYGVPVERYVFDVLRRMVIISKVNERGAMIWRLEQGVFIAWNQIVPEIHNLLEKDKVPGIPRSPDTLADILIERGFATPYQENAEAKPGRYWRIYPEALGGVSLNCLRLDDLELIFTSEPPVPAKASFLKPQKEKETKEVVQQVQPLSQTSVAVVEQSPPPPTEDDYYSWDQIEESHFEELPIPDFMEETPPPHIQEEEAVDKPSIQRQPKKRPEVENTEDVSRVSKMAALTANVEAMANLDMSAKKQPQRERPDAKTPPKNLKEHPENAPKEQSTKHDSVGWSYIYKAIDISGEHTILEKLIDGDYGIPYPESALSLGEPREVMNALASEGLLRQDQASNSKTAVISGKKYLVLNREVSRYIRQQLDNKESGAPSANDKNNPMIKQKKRKARKKAPSQSPQREATTTIDIDSNSSAEEGKASKRSYDRAKKQQTYDEVSTEFIKQMEQGFGSYIDGDVKVTETEETIVYSISKSTIDKMAEHLKARPSAVASMLRCVKGVQIHLDTIDLVQER